MMLSAEKMKVVRSDSKLDCLSDDSIELAFEYLNELRESGVTNMLGAGEYLEAEYDWNESLSWAVLSAWMKTFER